MSAQRIADNRKLDHHLRLTLLRILSLMRRGYSRRRAFAIVLKEDQ